MLTISLIIATITLALSTIISLLFSLFYEDVHIRLLAFIILLSILNLIHLFLLFTLT